MNLKLNPRRIFLGNRKTSAPVLLAVTPPRTGERTMLGVENLLQSIAVPEPFALELAGTADGVSLLARCLDREVVRGQLAAHYPQARIQEVAVDDDPIFVHRGEQAWGMTLRASGPEYVPLRTFRDDDLLDPGSVSFFRVFRPAIFTDIRPPWEGCDLTNIRSQLFGQLPPLAPSRARCGDSRSR